MKSLEEFCELVKAQMLVEGSTANVVFGRQHLKRRDSQGVGTANRVVIAPGDPQGNRGDFAAPIHAHVKIRPDRFQHKRWLTAQVWGYDSSKPDSDATQDNALEALLQCFMRSAQHVILATGHRSHGFYQAKQTYPLPPSDRRHGDMCQVVFWIGFNVRDVTPTETVETSIETVDAVVETV